MAKQSGKKKTPKDINKLAAFIVKETAEEAKHCQSERITPK
jgi:hypothetical protein